MDRREMLGMVGAGAIGWTAMTARADEKDEKSCSEACCAHDQIHAECLKACSDCAKACDQCFHHCFVQVAHGKTDHAKSLHLTSDCAQFCGLSACMIARHSPLMADSCTACAEACKATAAEVGKFDSDTMKKTAKALLECESSCRKMVAHMGKSSGFKAN